MTEDAPADDTQADDPAPDVVSTEEPIPADTEVDNSSALNGPAQEPPAPDVSPAAEPDVDPFISPSPVVDPLGLPSFSPDDYDDLLSLYFDGMTLDMLTSTSPYDSVTYLEQLCRDGDLPDYYCRDMYGD